MSKSASWPRLAPPIPLEGNCWKCGEPLAEHPVIADTCYMVCKADYNPGLLPDEEGYIPEAVARAMGYVE